MTRKGGIPVFCYSDNHDYPRIDGYNPEFLGAKPARAGEDY